MAAAQGVSTDETIDLTREQRDTIRNAMNFISTNMYNRLGLLTESNQASDISDCFTAVVHLLSSAYTPRYVSKQKRLETFANGNWDALGTSQTKEDMAECGFFYLKDFDCVRCFYCDEFLEAKPRVLRGKNPVQEHVMRSPFCQFLKCSLGVECVLEMSGGQQYFPSEYFEPFNPDPLIAILGQELASRKGKKMCSDIGVSETKVLLYLSRRYICNRKQCSRRELKSEMQLEMQKEMELEMKKEKQRETQNSPNDPPLYAKQFDLASIARSLYKRLQTQRQQERQRKQKRRQEQQQKLEEFYERQRKAKASRLVCHKCEVNDANILCHPCGHISLCAACRTIADRCPILKCSAAIENSVQVRTEKCDHGPNDESD